MTVLYFGNDINKPSHLWMRRMLDGLGDDVAQLVTEAPPGPYADHYRAERVPHGLATVGYKLLRRARLIRRLPPTRSAIKWFEQQLAANSVQVALVHYLTLAVKYEAVWRATEKPVFIHCHGQDVTWDLRTSAQPSRPVHAADYVERVRRLPANVQFIANSRRTVERLAAVGLDGGRVHLKYLGVPVANRCPAKVNDGPEVTVLYLGRLVDFKGPVAVIKAFDLACRRGLRGQLLVAGDGDQFTACRAARSASNFGDCIELLGAVDEATGERLRAQADIFTAHSCLGPTSGQEEAFGVSFVEAMADGIPVVSGRNGSLPEIVEHEREGLLFEPGDIESHANCLLRLASDASLRHTLGRNAWRRVRSQFSLEGEVVELRRILKFSKSSHSNDVPTTADEPTSRC